MFQTNLLDNQVALITGGGTGLGKTMATAFGQHGAKVVISSRKEAVLKQTTEELASQGIQASYQVCDVRDRLAVDRMITAIVEEYGHLDLLVNNAAGNFISPTHMLSSKGFEVIVDIVLNGTFNCAHAAGLYWMESKRKGTVLNISTTYADSGSGFVVPSACAKAGVNALTRSLAVEWAPFGIRMNAIAPGPIPTEGAFSRLMPGPEWEDKMKQRVPSGQFGTHADLANLALFLVSPLSRFITGEVIRLDGGEQLMGAGEFNGLSAIPADFWPELAQRMRKGSKDS